MAKILAVGIATLDIINSVPHYPAEDEELRAVSQRISRGGNSTNTLQVLARLGHEACWAGVLAQDNDAALIRASLEECGVQLLGYHDEANGRSPVSYITHNLQNGSRTIVHYRDLPEFSYEDFCRLPLEGIDWMHFEGRNPEETRRMMQQAKQTTKAVISVEMEKPRPGLEGLIEFADVVLYSRVYATAHGFDSGDRFLEIHAEKVPHKTLVCAWGDQGAYGIGRDAKRCHSPAFPPETLVDTLGAGDTFNAAVIDALLQDKTLEECLQHACRVAGRKCGMPGFDV